jgi:hypothetical protein
MFDMAIDPEYAQEKFRRSLDREDFKLAMEAARDVPNVALIDALKLTILAARNERSAYAAFARRLLARIVAEVSPPLCDAATVAHLLCDVEEGKLVSEKLRPPLETVIAGERLL